MNTWMPMGRVSYFLCRPGPMIHDKQIAARPTLPDEARPQDTRSLTQVAAYHALAILLQETSGLQTCTLDS